MRDAFTLPRASHRYFVEEISEHLHPMVMLSSRFLKFHQSLQKCHKPVVRHLCQLSSHNLRTAYCQNLTKIEEHVSTKISNLSCNKLKKVMKYNHVPDEEQWRVALVKDMLELRWNTVEIDVIEDQVDDLDAAIENLCVR